MPPWPRESNWFCLRRTIPNLFLPGVTLCFRGLLSHSMWLEVRRGEKLKTRFWCSISTTTTNQGGHMTQAELIRVLSQDWCRNVGRKKPPACWDYKVREPGTDWWCSSFLVCRKSQSVVQDQHMNQGPEDAVWTYRSSHAWNPGQPIYLSHKAIKVVWFGSLSFSYN